MIQATQITFAYPGQKIIKFPDLICESNEHALILGSSGTGKTTYLHVLGGLLLPASGKIIISNTPVHQLRGKHLDAFRGKKIGLIFQKAHFIKSISALENLLLTQNLSGMKPDKAHALQLMESLSIASKANKKTYDLSVGEQQRLAIARALINHPAVILADEPSSALDDDNCRNMIDLLLRSANENNANLIVVTHDSRVKDMIDKKIYLA